MDEYTDGWEGHRDRVLSIIETMVEEGIQYAGPLEDLHFRLVNL